MIEKTGFSHFFLETQIMGLSNQERISLSGFMKVLMALHVKKYITESLTDVVLGSTKGYFIICYFPSPDIIGQLNWG
jgi:hypothetical protein